jgi:hypothetical protein
MLFKIAIASISFLIKLIIFAISPTQIWAFPYISDSLKPLSELEKELQKLSAIITTHPSMESRLQANQDFHNKLLALLKRPDSYDYPFDSLPLVSRLYPKDQSFRIFTWTVQVIEVDTQYKKLKVRINNQFFGIVQRKLKIKKDIEKVLVLPLVDDCPKTEGLQNQLLDAQRWLGALYYHPRNSPYGVLTYYGKYRKFIDNKRSQIISIPYYVVLGWNQEGGKANFKIIEVITFDSKDSSKIYFGAPIFYTSPIPAYRMIFKYSPNAPFSLNLGLVKTGLFNTKKKMIVFDHLAMPKNARPQNYYEGGPDGTYDAFCYINRVVDERKGFFLLLRNVNVYDPAMDRYKESFIKKQLREEKKRLKKILKN